MMENLYYVLVAFKEAIEDLTYFTDEHFDDILDKKLDHAAERFRKADLDTSYQFQLENEISELLRKVEIIKLHCRLYDPSTLEND